MTYAYQLTYQTPMVGDLLLFRMKKREVYHNDDSELKILVNKKSKDMIQLYCTYTYSFAIYFDMLLQLF